MGNGLLRDFRWADMAAIIAVVASIGSWAKSQRDIGAIDGELRTRLANVESTTIDARAQLRSLPSLESQVLRLNGEITSLREDIAKFRDKLDEHFKMIVEGRIKR